MGTSPKERMRKLRQKREGRALSVWLYADTARMFKNIKTLTKKTNDSIINDAVQKAYESIFSKRCYEIINEIKAKQNEPAPVKNELTGLFRKLIEVLQLDYHSCASQKFDPAFSPVLSLAKIDTY